MRTVVFNEIAPVPSQGPVEALREFLQVIDACSGTLLVPTGAFDAPPPDRGRTVRRHVWETLEFDSDLQRRWARLLDQAFDLHERTEPWHADDVAARGLTAALAGNTLGLSFASDPWHRTSVTLRQGASSAHVRHASLLNHIAEHTEWLDASSEPLEALRRLLHCGPALRHMPASQYNGRKHVKGGTEEKRRDRAVRANTAQFCADLDDEGIRTIETEVLDMIRSDAAEDWIVQGSAVTFKVYARCQRTVGYEAGSGRETPWIRVEYASGEVHSHPHTPNCET